MADPKHANDEQEDRAVISLDLGDLGNSAADTPVPDAEKIEQVSVESGFGARAKPKTTEQPARTSRTTKPAAAKPKDRRRRSGRTHPFNTKIKPEAHQQLVEISDRLSDQEGRVVTMAEVIEKALICYEMKLAEKDSD